MYSPYQELSISVKFRDNKYWVEGSAPRRSDRRSSIFLPMGKQIQAGSKQKKDPDPRTSSWTRFYDPVLRKS
ncbi:hypothetical protein OUZ56_002478 [Daphnia magna]|uniref:Uncharacterized protein n=1 Tax=Daphnia magna TaxID=35525 RepID=A0ABR0A5U4_9CRUS|nr:hypothetical protein OUZ56_002478 [Daphnia magna]